MEEDRNLLDYIYVLMKWRRMIIGSVLVISLLTAGISLVLPKAWTARGVIMPPEEEFDQFGLSAFRASGMPGGVGGLMGMGTPADHLKRFLELNQLRGAIVDRFDLVSEYEASHRERASEILGENTQIELENEGALLLEVTASSPELAADLVNAMVAQLDQLNRELKSRQAQKLRQYLESRVQLRGRELQEAGRALLAFKQQHGLVDLDAQTEAVVDLAKFQVQELVMLEVQLGVAHQTVRAEHESRRELELKRNELLKQLRLLVGETPSQVGDLLLGPALHNMPELGFNNALLELDIRIKEEIVLFLSTKLEEARYKEHLDTPTLRILDVATPPKVRTHPRRTLLVLVAASVTLIMSTVLAFLFESWVRLGEQNRERLDAIRRLR